MLEALDLRKSFGNKRVLDEASFSLGDSRVVSLIGASGSGKTTFLRCLNLLERPDSGVLKFDGETYFDSSRDLLFDRNQVTELRKKMGMVFQEFNLWTHLTVEQNVLEAPIHVLKKSKEEATQIGRRILDRVGLAAHLDKYPDQLSGGEKQRVGIARALAMDPSLLLLDEPTSSLDPELVGEVLEVVAELAAEGRKMLIVTHEMEFAKRVSDRVVFVDEGKMAESGTPEEVFENPKSDRLKQFLSR